MNTTIEYGPAAETAANFRYGVTICHRIFNLKKFQPIERIIAGANSPNQQLNRAAREVLLGMATEMAQILGQLRDTGAVVFVGEALLEPDDLHFAYRTNTQQFVAQLQGLVNTCARTLEVLPGLAVSAAQPAPMDPPPPPPAQRVEIVGMPVRQTASEIVRDAHGNIVQSRQIENDLTTATEIP